MATTRKTTAKRSPKAKKTTMRAGCRGSCGTTKTGAAKKTRSTKAKKTTAKRTPKK